MRLALCASCCLFLLLTPTAAETLADDPRVTARLGLFEAWAREKMAYQHQPGMVAALVDRDGPVWVRAFGVRTVGDGEGEPMTVETAFRIGSISKLFTATAIVQLRDAGELRLDDPVVEHLPWLAFRDPFPDTAITVRHLLTHTSGLPREADLPYWTDRRFPDRETLAEALAEQEALFEPGTGYRYSNLGIALLGEVVAAVSGRPWADYVRDEILAPLEMRDTAPTFDALDPARLATGYLIRRGDAQPVAPATDAKALAPAADVTSTAGDLARFVAAHLRGAAGEDTPILRGRSAREMQRVHWLDPDWDSARGLGFSVWKRDERTLAGHGGWVAGFRSQVAFDPKSGFGVVVLTNSDEGGPGSYVRELVDFVLSALEAARDKPAPADVVARNEALARFAGTYRNPWGEAREVLVLDGALAVYEHGYPPGGDLAGSLETLEPVGTHTFRLPADHGAGDLVVFELAGDGDSTRVERVKVGTNYLFPADCPKIVGLACVRE